jgi:hypothetical protein
MKEIKVGIDPGKYGAIAWSINGSTSAESMPDTPSELAGLFKDILLEGPVRVYLEKVGGYIGGTGAPGSAMFVFGENFGMIQGVCAALDIPVELCAPQKWQKALSLGNSNGLSKTQWKNKLKIHAQQLFPKLKVTLTTADALLILQAAEKDLI